MSKQTPEATPSPSLRVSVFLVIASALLGAFISPLLCALAAVTFYLRRRTGPERKLHFTRIDVIVLVVGAIAVVAGLVLEADYRLTDKGLEATANPTDRLILGGISGALIVAFVLAALRRVNR
jgi:Mn2+/Fe2+ NRAMP family transporter